MDSQMIRHVSILLQLEYHEIVLVNKDLICLAITDKNFQRKEPHAFYLFQQVLILWKALDCLDGAFLLGGVAVDSAQVQNPIDAALDWFAFLNE